ncbi:chalcone isomerase family protein [Niveibacterium sp. SC-1]|uniref:chalcone isomerase family protein n=1 Tax=Niveibacterium sp. SC-1 TaxID=3135646 RepID=UPI00311E0CFC
MKITKPLRALFIASAFVASALAHAALDVEGIAFEDSETVANTKLLRNGASVSTMLSAKATAVGLYMTQRQGTMETAMAQKGAKRVRVVALREISAKDLATVLLDRIKQNASRDEIENNVLQFAALGGAFSSRSKLAKGDVVTLDYVPTNQTTEIRVNGELTGQPIMGDAFYPVLMKVWIGPKVRGATRDALLGASEHAAK